MKTQRELNLKYWNDTYEMVEAYKKEHIGADVKPWQCVKYNGGTLCSHPDFRHHSTGGYEFAVAILYDEQTDVHRPVWVGDRVFDKDDGEECVVSGYKPEIIVWSHYTLSKPKRTFEINGVELPCPVKNEDLYGVCIAGTNYHFKTLYDAVDVGRAINKILAEARDK